MFCGGGQPLVGSHWVALLIYCQALLAPHTSYWVCGKGNKKELQFVKYPNDINRNRIFLFVYNLISLSGLQLSTFSFYQVYEALPSCDRCTSDINTNKILFPCFQFYMISFYQVYKAPSGTKYFYFLGPRGPLRTPSFARSFVRSPAPKI